MADDKYFIEGYDDRFTTPNTDGRKKKKKPSISDITPENLSQVPMITRQSTIVPQTQYVDYSNFVGTYNDALQMAAQNQSVLDKWGNGVVKFGVNAGTAFTDGIVGTVTGLANIDPTDPKLSDFVNNPLSIEMSKWQERASENFMNYELESDQEKAWFQKLGKANFWADGVMSNLGYGAGMVASGLVTAGVGTAISGSSNIASNLAKGVLSRYIDDVGKQVLKAADGTILKTEKDVLKALATGKIDTKYLTKELMKDAAKLKRTNAAIQWTSSAVGALGESRLEAIQNSNQFNQELSIQAARDLNVPVEFLPAYKKKEIQNIADVAANTNFLLDFAVLTVSNSMQFSKVFGGYTNNRKVLSNIIKQDGKYISKMPTTKMGKVRKGIYNTTKSLKNAWVEGAEEQLQYAAGETGKNYALAMKDSESALDFGKLASAMGEGFVKSFNNEGLENFFIGWLSGGIGVPTISKRGLPTLAGGVWSDMKDGLGQTQTKYTDALVKDLNDITNSDRYKNVYSNVLLNNTSNNLRNIFTEEGDIKSSKDMESMAFISDANTFINAGRFDDFVSNIKSFSNTDATELRELASSNGIDIFANKTDSEVKDIVDNKVSAMINKADKIRKVRDAIEIKFPNLNTDYKDLLTFFMASSQDREARINDIYNELNELSSKIGSEVSNYYDNRYKELQITSGEEFKSLYSKYKFFQNTQKKNQSKIEKLTSEIENKQSLIDRLDKNIQQLNKNIQKQRAKKATEEVKETTSKTLTKEESKLNSLENDRDKLIDDIDNINNEINKLSEDISIKENDYNNQIESILNKKNKAVKGTTNTWELEDFVSSVAGVMDSYDNMNKEINKEIGINRDDLNNKLTDLAALHNERIATANMYMKAVSTNNPALSEELNKILEESNDEALSEAKEKEFKKFSDGAQVVDKEGNIYTLRRLKQPILVREIDGEIQEIPVTLDETFLENYTLKKVTEESTEQVVEKSNEGNPDIEDNTDLIEMASPEEVHYKDEASRRPDEIWNGTAVSNGIYYSPGNYKFFEDDPVQMKNSVALALLNVTPDKHKGQVIKLSELPNWETKRQELINLGYNERDLEYASVLALTDLDGNYITFDATGQTFGTTNNLDDISNIVFQSMLIPVVEGGTMNPYTSKSGENRFNVTDEQLKDIILSMNRSAKYVDKVLKNKEEKDKWIKWIANKSAEGYLESLQKLLELPLDKRIIEVRGKSAGRNTQEYDPTKDVVIENVSEITADYVDVNGKKKYTYKAIDRDGNEFNGFTRPLVDPEKDVIKKTFELYLDNLTIEKNNLVSTKTSHLLSTNTKLSISLHDILRSMTTYTGKSNISKDNKIIFSQPKMQFHKVGKGLNNWNIGGREVQLVTNEDLEAGNKKINPGFIEALDVYLANNNFFIDVKDLLDNKTNLFVDLSSNPIDGDKFKVKNMSLQEFLLTNENPTLLAPRYQPLSTYNGMTVPTKMNVRIKYTLPEDIDTGDISKDNDIKLDANTIATKILDSGKATIEKIASAIDATNKATGDAKLPKNLFGDITVPKEVALEAYEEVIRRLEIDKAPIISDDSTKIEPDIKEDSSNDESVPTDNTPIELSQSEQEISDLKKQLGLSDENEVEWNRINRNLTPGNYQEAKQWIQDKLGTLVGVKEVEALAKSGTFGYFMNNIIHLAKGFEVGTEYHEAIHYIYNSILTLKEQTRLLNEIRTSEEFSELRELIKEDPIYSTYNEDRQLQEVLAEAFREVQLGIREIPKKKGTLIRRILNWLKSLLNNIGLLTSINNVNDLYTKVDKGFYKAVPEDKYNNEKLSGLQRRRSKLFNDRVKSAGTSTKYESRYNAPENSELSGVVDTYEFATDAMEYIHTVFMKRLMDSEREVVTSLLRGSDNEELFRNLMNYVKGILTGTEIDTQLKIATIPKLQDLKKYFEEKGLNPLQDKDLSKLPYLEYMRDNWEETVRLYKDYVAKFNINIDIESYLEDEANNDGGKGNVVPTKSINLSSKANASNIVKFYLSAIPMTAKVVKEGTTTFVPFKGNLGGYKFVSYNDTFSALSNLLSNSTSLNEMVDRLTKISDTIPWMNRVIKRFKFDQPISELSLFEVSIQNKFFQAFAKQAIEYQSDRINQFDNENNLKVTDESKALIKNRINTIWKTETLKTIFVKDSIYRTEKVGDTTAIKYNLSKLDNFVPVGSGVVVGRKNTQAEKFRNSSKFLETIGIKFTNEANFTGKDKNQMMRIASEMLAHIKKNNIYIFSTLEDPNVTSWLNKLVDIEYRTGINYFENKHRGVDGSNVFNNTYYHYLAYSANLFNKLTPTELKAYTNFDPDRNTYLNSSRTYQNKINSSGNINIVLKEALNVDKKVEYRKSSDIDRNVLQFLNHKQGYYMVVRPSDNTLERAMHIDGVNTSMDIVKIDDRNIVFNNNSDFLNYLLDHLIDEITYKAQYATNKSRWNNLDKNKESGILLDILKDINPNLYSSLKVSIDKMTNGEWKNKNTREVVRRLLSGNNATLIKSAFGKYMSNYTKAYSTQLSNQRILLVTDKGIDANKLGLGTIQPKQLYSEISDFLANDMLYTLEQYKLLFGDTSQFKNVVDRFKRNSGFVGTKQALRTDDSFNKYIKDRLKRLDGMEGTMYNNKPIAKTMIIQDPKVYSELFKDVLEETDGGSFATLDAIRELYFRTDGWDFTEGGLEDLYQWEQQMYAWYLMQKGKLSKDKFSELYNKEGININWEAPYWTPINPETGKEIVKPNYVFNTIKPQYYGPYAEDGISVMGMYKTSFDNLLPSRFLDYSNPSGASIIKGREAMEKLTGMMVSNGISIVSAASANKAISTKVNSRNEVPSIYNENGEILINDDYKYQDELVTQDIYWEFLGIQQETGFKSKMESTSGSQQNKQIINGIYDNGIPRSEELGRLANQLVTLNNELGSLRFNRMLDKVGVEKIGDEYTTKDLTKLVTTLSDEAKARNLSNNIIESINSLLEDVSLDGVLNSERVEYILGSIIDSEVFRPKVFGKGVYQVPPTFFSSNNRQVVLKYEDTTKVFDSVEELNKFKESLSVPYTQYFTSTDLKFYEKSDTQTSRMEVYLPSWFKGKVDIGTLDKRLIQLMGFRIPTSGLNSIEAIEVKGFLPAEAGDMIVAPSELILKAGSDFDIDKMFLHIKNFYMKQGVPTYIDPKVPYMEYISDIETIFFSSMLGRIKREAYKEFKDIRLSEAHEVIGTIKEDPTMDGLKKAYSYILDKIESIEGKIVSDEYRENLNIVKSIIQDSMISYNSKYDTILTKDQYRIKQLENEIIETKEDIILNPENFNQLTTPVGLGSLEDMKKYITNKIPELSPDYSKFYNSINRMVINDITKQNFDGADAIGITALVSTFHIACAKNGAFVEAIPDKIVKKNGKSVIEFDNISTIAMPHNITDNGEVALGGYTDQEGKFIYERLSEYLNAAVDNAKELTLYILNAGPETLNTVLYLVQAGVPAKHVVLFMNQPIIREYLRRLNISKSKLGNKEIGTFEQYGRTQEFIVGKNTIINDLLKQEGITNIKEKPGEILLTEKVLENSLEKNINQNIIFREFLKYQLVSEHITNAIRGVSYDNAGMGRNIAEIIAKRGATNKALESGVIGNYDKILRDDQSLNSTYFNLANDSYEAIKPLFSSLENPNIEMELLNFSDEMLEDKFRSQTDYASMLNKWRRELLTYILFNNPTNHIDNKATATENVKTTLSEDMDRLSKYVPEFLMKIKEGKDEKLNKLFRNNRLLNALFPILDAEGNFGTNSIKLIQDAYDTTYLNELTDDWRKLINGSNNISYDDRGNNFGLDLVKFLIVQAGMYRNSLNFVPLVPHEIYLDLVKNSLSLYKDLSLNDLTEFTKLFKLNNYNRKDMVKSTNVLNDLPNGIYKKFEAIPEVSKLFGKDRNKKIAELKSKGINPYSTKPTFYDVTDGVVTPIESKNILAYNDNIARLDYSKGLFPIQIDNMNEILKTTEGLIETSDKYFSSNELNEAEDTKKHCKGGEE